MLGFVAFSFTNWFDHLWVLIKLFLLYEGNEFRYHYVHHYSRIFLHYSHIIQTKPEWFSSSSSFFLFSASKASFIGPSILTAFESYRGAPILLSEINKEFVELSGVSEKCSAPPPYVIFCFKRTQIKILDIT